MVVERDIIRPQPKPFRYRSATEFSTIPQNTTVPCTDVRGTPEIKRRASYVNLQKLALAVLTNDWRTVGDITRAINATSAVHVRDEAVGSALYTLAARHAVMQRRIRVHAGKNALRLVSVYRLPPEMENA